MRARVHEWMKKDGHGVRVRIDHYGETMRKVDTQRGPCGDEEGKKRKRKLRGKAQERG